MISFIRPFARLLSLADLALQIAKGQLTLFVFLSQFRETTVTIYYVPVTSVLFLRKLICDIFIIVGRYFIAIAVRIREVD